MNTANVRFDILSAHVVTQQKYVLLSTRSYELVGLSMLWLNSNVI